MEVVIDLVLDKVKRLKDYVMTCLVNRHVCENKRSTLLALAAVRSYDQYATVETVKFTQQLMQGLSLARFCVLCERVTLQLHPSQTETVDGIPRMQKKWRELLRSIVDEFYRRVKGMHSCDSYVHLDCKNKWDLLDAKSA